VKEVRQLDFEKMIRTVLIEVVMALTEVVTVLTEVATALIEVATALTEVPWITQSSTIAEMQRWTAGI
jgi:hypothetical protein